MYAIGYDRISSMAFMFDQDTVTELRDQSRDVQVQVIANLLVNGVNEAFQGDVSLDEPGQYFLGEEYFINKYSREFSTVSAGADKDSSFSFLVGAAFYTDDRVSDEIKEVALKHNFLTIHHGRRWENIFPSRGTVYEFDGKSLDVAKEVFDIGAFNILGVGLIDLLDGTRTPIEVEYALRSLQGMWSVAESFKIARTQFNILTEDGETVSEGLFEIIPALESRILSMDTQLDLYGLCLAFFMRWRTCEEALDAMEEYVDRDPRTFVAALLVNALMSAGDSFPLVAATRRSLRIIEQYGIRSDDVLGDVIKLATRMRAFGNFGDSGDLMEKLDGIRVTFETAPKTVEE